MTGKASSALALTVVVALSLLSSAGGQTTVFPARGIVVPGQSIGGITIGMTEAQVKQRWGANYYVCTECGSNLVWLYEYQGGEPLGAGIKFNVPNVVPKAGSSAKSSTTTSTTAASAAATGKVIAVFTLGSPLGWGAKGAKMFDPVSNVYNLFGNTGDVQCIGYAALTVRVGNTTMSFYTASGVIYGYALTAPSESPCQ